MSVNSSALQGRLCLVLAAVLWSFSGMLTRLLQNPTSLHLNEPALTPLQIAFFRALFAGLALAPLVRLGDLRFRPSMPVMVLCFATMNGLFLTSMSLGTAANAILLQNTAPFFVFLISVFFLGEAADRKSLIALVIGSIGMLVIVLGGGQLTQRFDVILMALGSGLTYGFVVLFLRALRDISPAFLAMQNHLGSAFFLSLGVLCWYGSTYWLEWLQTPTLRQLMYLACFGALQMAIPYWLFARSLRTVHPQEAGAITLLEPLLNPFWTYLVAPETDTPTVYTFLGGFLIIGALGYRYLWKA